MRSELNLLTVLKTLGIWSWRLLMSGLLFLVLCVVGLRVFLSFLPLSHDHLIKYLNDKLNTSFVVEEVSAEWRIGRPSLSVKGLSLKGNGAQEAALRINRLDFELNLRDSLIHWFPVFNNLEADGILLAAESDSDGVWSLRDIQFIRSDDDESDFNLQEFLQGIQQQNYVDLTNITIQLLPYGQAPLALDTRYFSIYEESGVKTLATEFHSDEGEIVLQAQGEGTERLNSDWSGLISVSGFNPVNWCALAQLCLPELKTVEMNVESHWQYNNGDWQLQGRFNVNDLVIEGDEGSSPPLHLSADIAFEGNSPKRVWAAQTKYLSIQSGELLPLQLNLSINADRLTEAVYRVDLPRIDLAQTKTVLQSTALMPEWLDELIHTLNPAGALNNLVVQYYPLRPLRDAMELTAELEEVSVDAWFGAPSAAHVNGQLNMGLLSGYLDLDTEQFQLGLTKLFRDVWSFDATTAHLTWDVLEQEQVYQLLSDNIQIKAPEGDLSGKLKLDIPLDGKPIYMGLDVVMTDGDASYTSKYLPSKLPTLSEELIDWLDNSIKGARVLTGGFRYDGYLEETDDPDDTYWGLYFDLENAHLDYSPDWPEIVNAKGKVQIDGDAIKVELDSAKALNTELENVSANIVFSKNTSLEITGQLKSNGEDLKKILTETPVDRVLKGGAREWDIQGDMDGSLSLSLPFEDVDSTLVDVSVTTHNASFAIPSSKLIIDNIQGALDFSTTTGLSAEQLHGRFLGDEVEASIFPGKILKDDVTVFSWSGNVSSDALQQWLPLDALSFLEGSAHYQGELVIGQQELPASLMVTSDMAGMEIELPPPFLLTAEDSAPLELKLDFFEQGDSELAIKLQDTGSSRVRFTENFGFNSATLQLGSSATDLLTLKDGRVVVGGDVSILDLEPWRQRFAGQPVGDNEALLLKQIDVESLKIGQLIYNQSVLEDLEINVHRITKGEEGVAVSVASQDIAGKLLLPDNIHSPYQFNIKRLHLPESNSDLDESERSLNDILAGINPRELPDVDVQIESLKVGARDFGGLSFNLRSLPGGKRIEQFNGALNGLKLSGDADWTYVNSQHKTSYSGTLSGKGIEAFQNAMGVSTFVTAESTKVYTQLNWEGAPSEINLSTLDGSVSLKLKDGKLRKLEGSAGALKLFGIFNVEALTRRLKLDFSDLYSKGISFDRLEGRVRFNQGLITFDEPLEIIGPSSDFKLDGVVDTNKNTMDMSLVVTLPVTSNLPVLSVLLGSAPQVAGIIYIADKLVGNQVDQLASIRYQIKGSLDNPSISLDRLFSNQAKKPKASKKKK